MISASRLIRPLFGIVFLDQLYLTLTYPLITLIFFDADSRLFTADTPYAVRSLWYGLCIALTNIMNIFFASSLSILSDKWGRKNVLMIEIASAVIFALGVACGIYIGSLALIFAGFVVKGAFSRTNPTALAIVGDMAPKEKKVIYMGYLQFCISLGAAAGPILGGYFANKFYFHQLNFSAPFFIAACLALINVVVTFFSLQESRPAANSQPFDWRSVTTLFLHPAILRTSLVLLFLQVSWSMYYQSISPILKTLKHFDAHQLGWFIGMIACWLAFAASVLLYVLHKYLRLRQILLASTYAMLIGLGTTLLACLYPEYSVLAWLGAAPIAAGDVIAYSCLTALYSSLVAPHQQGRVMGICFIIVASVWALTALLSSLLMTITPELPLVLAPAGTIVALILLHANIGRELTLNYDCSPLKT